jgi:hypothetical protein
MSTQIPLAGSGLNGLQDVPMGDTVVPAVETRARRQWVITIPTPGQCEIEEVPYTGRGPWSGRTIMQRFSEKIRLAADGCWIWTAGTYDSGYGVFRTSTRAISAHKWLYEEVFGPVPDGLVLDHRCHTDSTDCVGGDDCRHRPCANPFHLEPVTQGENMHRSNHQSMILHRAGTCLRGHSVEHSYRRKGTGAVVYCRICSDLKKQERRSHAAA